MFLNPFNFNNSASLSGFRYLKSFFRDIKFMIGSFFIHSILLIKHFPLYSDPKNHNSFLEFLNKEAELNHVVVF